MSEKPTFYTDLEFFGSSIINPNQAKNFINTFGEGLGSTVANDLAEKSIREFVTDGICADENVIFTAALISNIGKNKLSPKQILDVITSLREGRGNSPYFKLENHTPNIPEWSDEEVAELEEWLNTTYLEEVTEIQNGSRKYFSVISDNLPFLRKNLF